MIRLRLMFDDIHQRAGGKQRDEEQVECGAEGAAFRAHRRDQVLQRCRVMRNLQKPDKAQHAQPAKINLAKDQRQQAWQDGDQVNQTGEAENIFQTPPGSRAVTAGIIGRHAPDPQQVFDAENRH